MTGILAALRAGKFTCYGPAGVDETDLLATPDESDTTPPRGKFLETSRPDRLFLPVPPIFDDDPLLFGFFIDGSIEFYTDMNRHQEAFRNVVGVAKSFDLHRPYRTGRSPERVGALISRLPPAHRTPARGTPHRNLTIASWYLRLHGRSRMTSLEYPDGVVKIEVFPDRPADDSPSIDSARCDRITQHVLALRAPATPSSDARWASHLYPIHLTERYIKTQFRDDQSIRACL